MLDLLKIDKSKYLGIFIPIFLVSPKKLVITLHKSITQGISRLAQVITMRSLG